MKKFVKRLTAVIVSLCICSISPFVVFAEETEMTDMISSEYDLIEYDYITKTERVISFDEIFDYSAVTSNTYELSGMSSYLQSSALLNEKQGNSTFSIVDPTVNFERTSPIDSDGNPVSPYSGIVYLMMGYDITGDGVADWGTEDRGTGFMVAPDVMVTAAHCIVGDSLRIDSTTGEVIDRYPMVEMRIFPFRHGYLNPSQVYDTDYIFPEKWSYVPAFREHWNANEINEAFKYDWCVVKLQKSIPGAYCFSCTYEAPTVNASVLASGYPNCDLLSCGNDRCRHDFGYQCTTTGNILSVTERIVYFSNNIRAGDSGGALYYPTTYVCCGILTHGERNGAHNGGTRITPTIYNAICEYIQLD